MTIPPVHHGEQFACTQHERRPHVEARSRALQSPLATVNLAREWRLEMVWPWQTFAGATIDKIFWSGDFIVDGDILSGAGTGRIEEVSGGGGFFDHSSHSPLTSPGRSCVTKMVRLSSRWKSCPQTSTYQYPRAPNVVVRSPIPRVRD
jgi:hypothetical protein